MTDEATIVLRQALAATQSTDKEQRKQGEMYLESMERQPAYAQRLVSIVEAHCAGNTVEDQTMRTIAAVVFKNLVKGKWVPEIEAIRLDSRRAKRTNLRRACMPKAAVVRDWKVFPPPEIPHTVMGSVENEALALGRGKV